MKQLVLLLFVFPLLTFSQEQKAKNILDKLSDKTSSYSSIEAHFTNHFNNSIAEINETQNGVLYLQGDAFKLDLENQLILSDGETNWIYLKDEEEVNVSDDGTDEGELSPSKIFTLYEEGYKYSYIGEDSQNYEIHLYPIESGAFKRVELFIDKSKMQISSFVMVDKQGSLFSYMINKFITNQKFSDSFFVFDTSKYADVDVIDLR
ncbi:MAG: LolA family protein [Flavobacteriales bacterium]